MRNMPITQRICGSTKAELSMPIDTAWLTFIPPYWRHAKIVQFSLRLMTDDILDVARATFGTTLIQKTVRSVMMMRGHGHR